MGVFFNLNHKMMSGGIWNKFFLPAFIIQNVSFLGNVIEAPIALLGHETKIYKIYEKFTYVRECNVIW